MTLTDLCMKLRNWFDVSRHIGSFKIENGTIDLDFIREGQFYRLIGSSQDGIFYVIDGKLRFVKSMTDDGQGGFSINGIIAQDEEFEGAIWELRFKLNFIMLYSKMCEWETKYVDALNSPYQSESWGSYSMTLKTGQNGNFTVFDKFKNDLSEWQKI